MAQTIKLRRSNTAGAVPTTGQMETGELAMNTADGKLFLRDNASVRPIVTVDNLVTGSINLSGSISASYITFPDIADVDYRPQVSANGRLELSGSSIGLRIDSGQDFRIFNLSENPTYPPVSVANTVMMYHTSSGYVYYTASSAIGGSSISGTPGQVLYFDNSGDPAGNTELTFAPSSGKFQVGDEFASFATTTNNPWNQPGYEATGSTIISEKNALITNADYTFRRFNLLGLAEHGSGPSGVVGGVLPTTALPTAYDAPVPGLLPPPSSLDDYRMGINGQLRLGNLWAWVYPDGKTDVMTYGSFVSVPGSPGMTMGEGGFRLFASESMVFDISGSLLTPKESASIEFTLADDSNDPALMIKVRDENSGKQIPALYVSQSGGRPLIGVGTTTPRSAFDVRDIKDDGSGTEFVFQTTRTSQGGQIGDKAGTINFTVDSGSYADYKTSGSIALIESEVTGIDATGVKGDLIFKSSNNTKLAPTEVLRINSSTSTFKSALKTEQSLTIGSNSVLITNIEDTPSGDTLQTIDLFSLGTYDGAVYDYTLVDSGNGYMRIGQFMVISDGSTVSYTDTSTRAIGGDISEPVLSATYSGGVAVQITNGGGYVFKSLRKLI